MKSIQTLFRIFAVTSSMAAALPAADKTLIDYFLPIPVQGHCQGKVEMS